MIIRRRKYAGIVVAGQMQHESAVTLNALRSVAFTLLSEFERARDYRI